MTNKKNILLAVTGGIAVYKAIDLASRLIKENFRVKVVMTDNAQKFVSPLSFSSIIDQPVITELFDQNSPIEHISLAEWADILVIAPATANIIGKIASGIADDLLSTTIMAMTKPILLVPTMNTNMYNNPILQDNLKKLREYGYHILPPASGRLACGAVGEGRYPDNEEIIFAIKSRLIKDEYDLKGEKVLITLGACREYLDPMRFISNVSSGKMGLALARSAYFRGAEVIMVAGNTTEPLPHYIVSHKALSSEQMAEVTLALADKVDYILMNAAVTDFKPKVFQENKIKKDNLSSEISINLQPTTDILSELGKIKKDGQMLIGFAAETENLEENARKKLIKKNADIIIANHINTAGKNDTTMLLVAQQNVTPISGTKLEAAHLIWNYIKG
jgi:phosphopantothenoylcysteine decarboxylase/phosphopantothenate--cysteine ligase